MSESKATELRADIEPPAVVAARLGLPIEWVQMHYGVHRCVDGKIYRVSCLVVDPACDRVARYFMRITGVLPSSQVSAENGEKS